VDALPKIRDAGYVVALSEDGERIGVTPAEKLTSAQCAYLKAKKAEIVAALRAEDSGPPNDATAMTREVFGDDAEAIPDMQVPKQEIWANAYTPKGELIRVKCDSEKHRQWVEAMNPPRTRGDSPR
jgi:hypothetical protein